MNDLKKSFMLILILFISYLSYGFQDNDSVVFSQQDWKIERLADGVIREVAHVEGVFESRQVVNIIRVALNEKSIQPGIHGKEKELIPTSVLAKEKDAVAAINGGFFNMKEGGAVDLIKVEGEILTEDMRNTANANGFIGINANQVVINSTESLSNDQWDNIMVSGPLLLQKSQSVPVNDTPFSSNRHPRTAAGITADNELLLITVDGRNEKAQGMSLPELTKILKWLGAVDAMNLDGGGSTTLFTEKEGVVNYPSDNANFDHKGERKVANIIYVRSDQDLSGSSSYKAIHKEAIVADTHNDIIDRLFEGEGNYTFDQYLSGITHTDLNRMKEGGLDVQVFSVFCDEKEEFPFEFANRAIDSVYEWVRRNPKDMMLVTNSAELDQALKQHKIGAMIGVEGGHMIEDDLAKLDSLFNRGARYLTLTWNNNTSWATSAAYESGNQKDSPFQQKGLTAFGKQVVKRMNELGMMVDLSHPGEETFWDAIQTSTKPVLVSHSNTFAIAPVPRNLTDDQIRAIGKNGGVISLNFYTPFVQKGATERLDAFENARQKEREKLRKKGMTKLEIDKQLSAKFEKEIEELKAPFHLLFDHMEHIIDLIGVDHVGLGGDFDGFWVTPVQKLDDVSKYPLITEELVKRGYTKEEIFKILGGNFLRVFRANML